MPAPKISTGSIGGLPPRSRTRTLQNDQSLGAALPPGFTPMPVPRAPGGLQSGLALGLSAIGAGIAGDPSHMSYALGIIQGRKAARDDALRANATMRNQATLEATRENYVRARDRARATETRETDARRREAEIADREDKQGFAADEAAKDRALRRELAPSSPSAYDTQRDDAGVDSFYDAVSEIEATLTSVETGQGAEPMPNGGFLLRDANQAIVGQTSLEKMRLQLEMERDRRESLLSPEAFKKVERRYQKTLERLDAYELGKGQKKIQQNESLLELMVPKEETVGPTKPGADVRIQERVAERQRAQKMNEAREDADLIERHKRVEERLTNRADALLKMAEQIESGSEAPGAQFGAFEARTVQEATLRELQHRGIKESEVGVSTAAMKLRKLSPQAPPAERAQAIRDLVDDLIDEINRIAGDARKIATKYPETARARLLGGG